MAQRKTLIAKTFTGEQLAQAHLLHLTQTEIDDYFKKGGHKKYRVHSNGFFATLGRRINPRKIFLIRFQDGHGVIIMADNETDACIQSVPFLNGYNLHCVNPRFNKSCPKCRSVFNELAERLNKAVVTWLGWGQPDYNWAIDI